MMIRFFRRFWIACILIHVIAIGHQATADTLVNGHDNWQKTGDFSLHSSLLIPVFVIGWADERVQERSTFSGLHHRAFSKPKIINESQQNFTSSLTLDAKSISSVEGHQFDNLLVENEYGGIDWGTFHKFAGYGTLLMAGGTAISSSNRSVHYGLAYGTAVMALVTFWSGVYEHNDRFDLYSALTSEDNLHIILGTIGTIACLTAVAIADSGENSSHAGIGGAGAVTMAISIFVIRW